MLKPEMVICIICGSKLVLSHVDDHVSINIYTESEQTCNSEARTKLTLKFLALVNRRQAVQIFEVTIYVLDMFTVNQKRLVCELIEIGYLRTC